MTYWCFFTLFPQYKPNSFKAVSKNGFTLIEVLIAMVVVAFGLLGFAGSQARGLKNNLSAYNRGQATQLAYDMADRIRVNVTEANKGAASIYATVVVDDAAEKTNCKQIDNACSTADMAENDLFEWNGDVLDALPSGTGTITFDDPGYTISVAWDDDRDTDTPALNFQMSFRL